MVDWLNEAKSLVDKVGGIEGIKDSFNKTMESDTVKRFDNKLSIENHLRKVEGALKEVTPDQIAISQNEKSELVEFIQKGLVAMGHNITVDGIAGEETIAAFNTALMDKVESVGFMTLDKLKDIKEIDDITQLTGRHVQVFVDELRDRDILDSGSPEMLRDLGQALREINDDKVSSYAQKLDPEGDKTPQPQSSLDNDHNITLTAPPVA